MNAAAGIESAYRDVRPRVYRYLRRKLKNHDTIKELTQETFTRALGRAGAFTPRCGRSTCGDCIEIWLMRIAERLVLDHVKAARFRRELLVNERRWHAPQDRMLHGPRTQTDVIDALAEPVPGADHEALRNVAFATAVRQLEPGPQTCLVLRFHRDLSIDETAVVMGRTNGAVRALQHRAIASLRERGLHPPRPLRRGPVTPMAEVPRGIWLRDPRSHRCRRDRCTHTPGRSGYCVGHYHNLYRAGRLIAGFTDPAPARRHIHEHLTRGGSLRSLARLSGTDQTSLSDITAGRTKRVRVGVSDAILAVPLRPSNAQCSQWIRDLALAGHSIPDVAAACGVPATTLYKAVGAGRFVDYVARKLPAAYRALSARPGRSPMAARLAKAKARKG